MDMKNFGSFKTLRNFLLAPSLLILAFPFFYFVAIYSAYEQLFLRIEIGLGDNKKLIRYAKRKMFYLFLLNLKKLQLALNQSVYNLISIKEMKDINNMIMVYKENFFKSIGGRPFYIMFLIKTCIKSEKTLAFVLHKDVKAFFTRVVQAGRHKGGGHD